MWSELFTFNQVGNVDFIDFVDEKAKVNAAYYVEKLLPLLVNDCKQLLPSGFILEQDCAPACSHGPSDPGLAKDQ